VERVTGVVEGGIGEVVVLKGKMEDVERRIEGLKGELWWMVEEW
jgi:hypothetical protein